MTMLADATAALARDLPPLIAGLWITLELLVVSSAVGIILAYVAEVIRGGILGVPKGEREAALAVGMPRGLLIRRIILPRAFRVTLPALSNEVVLQLKATSLASTVTLLDVTGVGRRIAAKTYTSEALFMAGAIYIVLTVILAQGFRLLERRFNAYQRP